jgi:isochorismate pyruvate lyase
LIECESLENVRENIDRIDREIVKLISERSSYVRQAARFKKTTDDVKAPNRVEQVIANKRAYAKEIGLDPDMIEKIYRTIILCFIDQELKEYESGKYKDARQ